MLDDSQPGGPAGVLPRTDPADRDRLIRGAGRFSDDLVLPGRLHGVFVRSAHAHARLVAVETAAARAAPGVALVLTAAELDPLQLGNVSVPQIVTGRDGASLIVPHRPALAADRVMHVGQPVALVVAATRAEAEDAALLIEVGYDPLPAVAEAREALLPGAPQLWPQAPGNRAVDFLAPADPALAARIDDAFAGAAHRVRVELVHQRLSAAPMEPRAATARFEAESGTYVLQAGSQGAGALGSQIAAVLGVPPARVRVETGDVGGSFGLKTHGYPEYAALLAASRLLGRPVHWAATRSEAFMSDNQGRDHRAVAELALAADGRFLALRSRSEVALGAFVSAAGAHIACNNFTRCLPGMYAIPLVQAQVTCVFTNTLPTGPYRGAGRPEANYLLERLVDAAAAQIGLDPVALRRRNLIAARDMPARTALGNSYDSGEFEAVLDAALEAGDHRGFPARRAAARARGRLRGLGVSCFLEHAGGSPVEGAIFDFAAEPGRLTIMLGVHATGQQHERVFARLLAERLGLPEACIAVRSGRSDAGIRGGPTVASRSAMAAGTAVMRAADALVAKACRLGAVVLDLTEARVAWRDGELVAREGNRRLGLFDLAAEAQRRVARGEWSEDLGVRVEVEVAQSYPNGCHIAEVEIDPDTGLVAVERYTAVDDCGVVLDGHLAEGQVIGGLAQGLGQALLERIVYDEEGQILTGSFMDYALPRASDMPEVCSLFHPVPCRTNPLGVKGVGEAGTTAAIAAIMNAIADAIPGGAGRDIEMPATPEKVWRACRRAAAAAGP